MKLVILDGNALNPGDLSWDSFKKYADITVFPRTSKNEVVERIGNNEAVLLNKVKITREILSECKNVRYIGLLGTGYDGIDREAAKEAGICVTNIPSYSTMAVAQHVFAFLLYFSNSIAQHNLSVQEKKWMKSPDYCYWETQLFELYGKTLGILGYGNIGRQVEKIAEAFGMNVIVCPHHPSSEIKNCVSFDELLQKSDVITLHTPLTTETENIINASSITKMRDGIYLINTARGGLVNERDIRAFLESKKIAGYASDVLETEPMAQDCPLFNAPNCIITPHIAWTPLETRRRLMKMAFENFESWINGNLRKDVLLT